MKIISGKTGSPHVTSQQFRQIFEGIIGDESCILPCGENLTPELQTNNSLKIRSGLMYHHGNLSTVELGTYDEVTIQNGTQGMKRIDLVVNRYTREEESGTEKNEWIVIQGTPHASSPTVPDYTEGNLQDGDLVDDCPYLEVHLDGINVTEVKQLLSVANAMSTTNKDLAELFPQTYDDSALALQSHWQIMTFDAWKEADVVHIMMEIYTTSVIVANHLYTINTPDSTDPDIRPKKTYCLSAFASDASYGNTVPVSALVQSSGAIQISIPDSKKPYIFISGAYRVD